MSEEQRVHFEVRGVKYARDAGKWFFYYDGAVEKAWEPFHLTAELEAAYQAGLRAAIAAKD